MGNDVKLFTTEELHQVIESAEGRAYMYKNTKDGSYGAALDSYGYYKAKAELKRREE